MNQYQQHLLKQFNHLKVYFHQKQNKHFREKIVKDFILNML